MLGLILIGLCFNLRYVITFIINKTCYENSDWARAYSPYTIACEVNMIFQYLQEILGYHVVFEVCSGSKPLFGEMFSNFCKMRDKFVLLHIVLNMHNKTIIEFVFGMIS